MGEPFLILTIPGDPIPKGRPRFTRHGHTYTPGRTGAYERELAITGSLEMEGRDPTSSPIRLVVEAVFSISERELKRKVPGQAYLGRIDVDNLLKIVGDGLNKIVWLDDKQIVEATISKKYGIHSSLRIEVYLASS